MVSFQSWITEQLSLFEGLYRKRSNARKLTSRARARQAEPSCPELFAIWTRLAAEYFPNHPTLIDYTIVWSKRTQRRVLASCSIHSQKVRVAQELRSERGREWLDPLLYHEMCHAVLGTSIKRDGDGRTPWHGSEFRALEARHPRIGDLDAWIRSGGWSTAVRSHRSRQAHAKRRAR